MKKRILALLIVTVCALMLASCGCKHEWVEASCLAPKTCSLCAQTEGEALGHEWADATCAVPKTCSACAATEGQTLPHSEAVRDCAIDYKTLIMERQTYCTNCDQILSSEEILLDTLHDGTHFLFDSKGFLDRYTVIDEQFTFMYLDVVVSEVKEETTKDTLILECRDQFGYMLRVRFSFSNLVEGDGEYTIPRCTRIVVDPAVSGELGDPDPDGLLDALQSLAQTPDEVDEINRLRDQANTVALNDLKFRNLMIGFMVLDPSLETDFPDMDTWGVLLDILDVLNGENPGFVFNNIHYYANEDGELVIEPAP